jgi:hypothetical protein
MICRRKCMPSQMHFHRINGRCLSDYRGPQPYDPVALAISRPVELTYFWRTNFIRLRSTVGSIFLDRCQRPSLDSRRSASYPMLASNLFFCQNPSLWSTCECSLQVSALLARDGSVLRAAETENSTQLSAQCILPVMPFAKPRRACLLANKSRPLTCFLFFSRITSNSGIIQSRSSQYPRRIRTQQRQNCRTHESRSCGSNAVAWRVLHHDAAIKCGHQSHHRLSCSPE